MITVKRGADPWRAEPLTWRLVTLPDGRKSADVTCARGHDGLIDEHEIAADGTVSPSVVCTGYPAGDLSRAPESCDWHEHIKLEGWPP